MKKDLYKTFNSFLDMKFAEDYHGCDDDMSDKCDEWKADLSDECIVNYFSTYLYYTDIGSKEYKKITTFINDLI